MRFRGVDYDRKRYDRAFLESVLSEWRFFEAWEPVGSADTELRAYGLWQKLVEQYEPPPNSDDRKGALQEFVARRTAEILG